MRITDQWLSQFTELEAECVLESFRKMGYVVRHNLSGCFWQVSTR